MFDFIRGLFEKPLPDSKTYPSHRCPKHGLDEVVPWRFYSNTLVRHVCIACLSESQPWLVLRDDWDGD